jgi:hypothetical protein
MNSPKSSKKKLKSKGDNDSSNSLMKSPKSSKKKLKSKDKDDSYSSLVNSPKSSKKKLKSKDKDESYRSLIKSPKDTKKKSKKSISKDKDDSLTSLKESSIKSLQKKKSKKKSSTKKQSTKEKKTKKEKELRDRNLTERRTVNSDATSFTSYDDYDDPYLYKHKDDDENDDDEENNGSEKDIANKMKNMLAQWDDSDASDSSLDDESDESDDDDIDSDYADADKIERMMSNHQTKDQLGLMDGQIDHIVLAAPDYDEAIKEFSTITGIVPARVGTTKGLGMKAARVAFDENCYIEIIAPDPKSSGPIGDKLAKLEDGALVPYHYAIRASNLEYLQDDYVPNELGYIPDRINLYSTAPDGSPAKWGLLFMQGHYLGGVVPYYVDWGRCSHPLSGIPQVGKLKGIVVTAPAGSQVHNLMRNVKHVTTEVGEPALEFAVGSPEGTITFSSGKPEGIVFPGGLGFAFPDGGPAGGGKALASEPTVPSLSDLGLTPFEYVWGKICVNACVDLI